MCIRIKQTYLTWASVHVGYVLLYLTICPSIFICMYYENMGDWISRNLLSSQHVVSTVCLYVSLVHITERPMHMLLYQFHVFFIFFSEVAHIYCAFSGNDLFWFMGALCYTWFSLNQDDRNLVFWVYFKTCTFKYIEIVHNLFPKNSPTIWV